MVTEVLDRTKEPHVASPLLDRDRRIALDPYLFGNPVAYVLNVERGWAFSSAATASARRR